MLWRIATDYVIRAGSARRRGPASGATERCVHEPRPSTGEGGRVKIIMTLLVRDAEDLLRENLEYHLRQGVDFFLVTDNGSLDGTSRIIADYVAAGLAESIFEPQDDYSQARWVTRMARRAEALGADWVINSDDDEFWRAGSGNLREVLAAVAPRRAALEVERYNHPPVGAAGEDHFLARMIYRERRSSNALGHPLPPKVLHRAFPDVEVAQGNHEIRRSGRRIEAAKTAEIIISHYPVRDYASFERKIVSGGAAYERNAELGPQVGATWRRLYKLWQARGLGDWYERQVLGSEAIAQGLRRGSLVRDEGVLTALRAARENR
jgi:hypothetical protein